MRKLVKKLFCINILLLLFGKAIAQQLPLYSQYMMNGFLINPAIAGSDGYTTTSLTTRDHWAGLNNSPKTYALSVQTRVLWSKTGVRRSPVTSAKNLTKRTGRVGLGAYVFNDKNALISRTGFQVSYAYHIFIRNTQLSFGLSASAFQFRINQDDLKFRDQADPLLLEGFNNLVYVPDFTFGMYLLDRKNFLGFSATNLFQTKFGKDNIDYRTKRHYYLLGGHRFSMNKNLEFEPSVMLKGTEMGMFQADINLKFIHKEFYWLGLSYRTQSAIGLLIGGRAKKVYIGYAFDYNLSDLQKYTIGSHELNIAIKFGDNTRRYRWLIRY